MQHDHGSAVKYKQTKAYNNNSSDIAANSSPSANWRSMDHVTYTFFMYALRATECQVNETRNYWKRKFVCKVKLQLNVCVFVHTG